SPTRCRGGARESWSPLEEILCQNPTAPYRCVRRGFRQAAPGRHDNWKDYPQRRRLCAVVVVGGDPELTCQTRGDSTHFAGPVFGNNSRNLEATKSSSRSFEIVSASTSATQFARPSGRRAISVQQESCQGFHRRPD